MPRFRLQILPAIEIGPRLHTWVARASFLSPPLRGWPPSQRKALEGTVWRGGRGATAPSSRPDFIVHLREELWPGWFPYEASGEGSRSFQCSLPYLSRNPAIWLNVMLARSVLCLVWLWTLAQAKQGQD